MTRSGLVLRVRFVVLFERLPGVNHMIRHMKVDMPVTKLLESVRFLVLDMKSGEEYGQGLNAHQAPTHITTF